MEEDLKLRDVLEIVRRHRRLIATVVACGIAAAVLFLLAVTPRYTAQATLKFDPRQFQITAENKNVGPELFERLIAGEIAVIRSPEVIEKVIAAEKLTQDSEFGQASLFDRLRGILAFGADGHSPEARLLNRARERFLDRLFVDQPPRSNLITIAVTSRDAVKAARIANAITTQYLTQQMESQLGSSPLASRWLGERKAKLKAQWRASEETVEAFKAQHNLRFAGGENLKEQQIARLNEQLIQAGSDVEETRSRVEQIRRLIRARDYTSSPMRCSRT